MTTPLVEPAPAAPIDSRPIPPTTSGPYLVPLVAMVGGVAVAGALLGSVGLLWGAAVGAVLAGALWWAGPGRRVPDAAALVAAAAAGLWWVGNVLDGREGPLSLDESLPAAAGFLLLGLAFAVVMWRSGRGYTLAGIVPVALLWAAAGVLAIQWAEPIGFAPELRNRAIEAGEIQELGNSFYAWLGALTVMVGAGTGLALHVGRAALAALSGSVLFTLFTANAIEFSFGEIIGQFDRFGELAEQFWPPQWTWPDFQGQPPELQILTPMIETFQIAIVGATLGCLVALPVAFLASRPTTYNGPVFWVSRFVMNVLRTIPDLFWAIFFATAVGAGRPLAGALAMIMFSMTIMAKLFSETVDTLDPGPLEAARAGGARHSQMVQYSALPQVFPNYVAYALYIFELNIRASVVIGLVGAGGIGLVLNEQRSFFQWDRVMAIVLVIFAAVIVIELISIAIRKRLV